MSTLALPAVSARSQVAMRPPAWLIVALGAGVALVLRELSAEAFLWWSVLGLAALCVRSFVRRDGVDACDVLVLFTLYYALAMLLRGIGLLTFVDSPYLRELGDAHSAHFRDLVGWSQFYSALALFAIQEGQRSRVGLRWASALTRRLPALAAPWRSARVTPVAVALMCIGVAGAAMRVGSLEGFMRAATNPIAACTDEALGHWWQIALTEFAVVGFHVHMMRLLLRDDRRFLTHYFVIGLALCVPIYLVGSSKSFLLRTLLVPWLVRHFVVRRIAIWHVVLAFVGFSALFPFFYAYRSLGLMNMGALGLYLQNDDAPLLHVFNRAYGADSLMLILHRTGVTLPFQWGASLSDLLTFWIPRNLWPAKPDSFGLQFPALYMPDMHWGALTYVSSSLPGELYLNFHVVGVLAGSWLLGAAMRASRALTLAGPGGILVYCYALLTAMHLVEGCIAAQLEYFFILLVPTLIALPLITAGARARRAAGAC